MEVLKKIIVGISSAILLTACLKEEQLKLDYQGYSPLTLQDDWTISTPMAEGVDPDLLEKAYQLVYVEDRFPMARSLLVLRNGKLIAEAYPNNPADYQNFNNIQSCTKSFTSMAVGMALEQGAISDLDEKLYDLFPEHFDEDGGKRKITLRHALSMQMGLEFDNSEHTLELYQEEGSSVDYVLDQDYLYPPGLITNYNDGAPHLVSAVIQQKTGKPLAEFMEENLFQPLNITDWQWEAARDGVTYGAFSLFMKPRDIAKVGQLWLQDGHWQGEQLLDSAYLKEATSAQVTTTEGGMPYGYYFWIYPALRGYAAIGHGGQFILVVPEKQLVAVYTAWPYTSSKLFDSRSELMQLLVSACE